MSGETLKGADNLSDVFFCHKLLKRVLIFWHKEYITKWKPGNSEQDRQPGLHYKKEWGTKSWGIFYCKKRTEESLISSSITSSTHIHTFRKVLWRRR
jgi:hypothetical protein